MVVRKACGKMNIKSFYKDLSYTAVGQLVIMLLLLVTNKIISSYFSPDDFAIYSIASKVAGVLAFLMLCGLGIALPVYLPRLKKKSSASLEANYFYSALLVVVSMAIFFGGLSIYLSDPLSLLIFGDDMYAPLILGIVLLAISTALSAFTYSYYRGIGQFKIFTLLQVALQVVAVVLVVLSGASLSMQLELRGVVIAILALTIVIYILSKSYRSVNPKKYLIKKNIRDIMAFCAPRVPGEIFLFSFSVVPLVIINAKYGSSVTAGFATAVLLMSFVVPVFQFVGTALLPHVSRSLHLKKFDETIKVINKLRKIYLLAAFASLVVVLVLTDLLIRILFTAEYVQFADTVRIVQFAVVPYALYLLLRNPIDAISVKAHNTLNLFISLSILITLLIFTNSATLAALSFPLAYACLGILSEVSWRREFHRSRNGSA